MAYRRVQQRTRARRGLSGLSSQPPGRAVSIFAMGGLSSQPPGRAVSRYALGTLGDDTTALTQPTVGDVQTATWQQQVLANQQAQLAQADKDHLQKWVQIGVTASIPLFGAIWKLIFGASRD